MNIQSQEELDSTRKKLRHLEAWYEARRREPAADPDSRAISLRSLKQAINQFKEEMVRYETGSVPQPRGIPSDQELVNTQAKLRRLEERYRMARQTPSTNSAAQRATLRSLKQLINQLTEEIVRYEVHAKVKGRFSKTHR